MIANATAKAEPEPEAEAEAMVATGHSKSIGYRLHYTVQ